ncbi:hypothetical protein H257_08907 [Aphanomyces astaci]|uniref:DDE Tnp4 domain-containing protein n=1 Tax=Aphanomyces astaci TaxID=112090 RepID=W4GCT6_APHAT|nr:hypothetical protein H257_08907 [Aphanomyces astaci]ETV77497.1 hypothetical protein H257_08907 [Aphanomyces astaci]|eukprot:XP_009833284.1 hypothetical protein H257_08907 [Aphanomyces astaci]
MAALKGHRVVLTSPHHSDLQPIELVWAIVKGQVGRRYTDETGLSEVKARLEEAFDDLKPSSIQGCIKASEVKLQKLYDHLVEIDAFESDEDSSAQSSSATDDSDSQVDTCQPKKGWQRFSTSLAMPLQADKHKNDFNEVVLSAMVRLYPTVMRPPGSSIPWEIHSNPKMFPFFKGCVGALDGTHVPAIPPPSGAKPFRNRKGYMSQNILAACTFDLKFTYVLAGWEGSASDGRVLEDALLNKGFVIPPGKMYLAQVDTCQPKKGWQRFSTSLAMPLQADKHKNDFNEVVLSAMVRLYPTVMRPPGSSIPWEIHSNPKMFPFFKGCVGALDGTHVPAIPPPSGAKPFRNRKGYMSQNILAACTFDLKFTYVLAGWEGSASDGRVLEDALLNKGFVIPPGKMYLGIARIPA